MPSLSEFEKATILDDQGEPLTQAAHGANSDTPEVALCFFDGGLIWVKGVAPGTAVITATRNADGATATLEVTVTEVPFSVTLGTPEPQ